MSDEIAPPHNQDGGEPQGRLHLAGRMLRERAFFYGLLLILALLTFLLLLPSLSPILLAVAAVVIAKPLYDWFMAKKWVRGKTSWAVGLTIVTSIVLIVVPMILFISIAVSQATGFFANLSNWTGTSSFQELITGIRGLAAAVASGEALDNEQQMLADGLTQFSESVGQLLGDSLAWIGQSISAFLVDGVVVLVIVMVMLPRYRQPDRDTLGAVIPFPKEITNLYLDKIQLMMTAMFRGTFVIAIVTGIAMALVLWIAGVPNSMFLGLVSMVLSVLPVIGVSLVAWPAAILLLLAGQIWQAVFVIAMLILVVGNIDTFLRPYLVPKGAYLNPALLILSVFGGLKLMGVVGALYGPVIMILLVTSLEIYTKYILRSDLEPYLDENGALDLKKLGLEPEEDSPDKAQDGILSLANKFIGRVLSQGEETEGEQSKT